MKLTRILSVAAVLVSLTIQIEAANAGVKTSNRNPNKGRAVAKVERAAAAQAENEKKAPEADPKDVDTMDHILKAVYDVISGPAGQKRNWDRMRSLFVPGARLIPTIPLKPEGYGTHMYDVEGYINAATNYFDKQGFFERESSRKTESFGHIAQVFSTYESRHAADDARPFERGINSFQLMNDGKRWWIVTIFWEGESAKVKIPAKYLPKHKQARRR